MSGIKNLSPTEKIQKNVLQKNVYKKINKITKNK